MRSRHHGAGALVLVWGAAFVSLLSCTGLAVSLVRPTSLAPMSLVDAHVHTGGLGWIALALLALASQQFDAVFSLRRTHVVTWSTPRWGIAACTLWLVIGLVIGAMATVRGSHASRLGQIHAAGLTVPFVFLAMTAILEWAADPAASRVVATTAGLAQIGLIFLGGLALLAGDATHDLPLLVANVPMEIAGVTIFLVRCGPTIFRSRWWRSPAVWLGLSTISLAIDIGLFAHVVLEVARRRYLYIELVPRWLVFAVDHTTFVAVGSTALFGALASFERGPGVLSTFDLAAASGLVIGLVGTLVGIAAGRGSVELFFVWFTLVAIVIAVASAFIRLASIARRPGVMVSSNR